MSRIPLAHERPRSSRRIASPERGNARVERGRSAGQFGRQSGAPRDPVWYAPPAGARHARHPGDPQAVSDHRAALPGARRSAAEAAHLPGPRREHAPAAARARDLQGLPRALLRQRPPGPAPPVAAGDRPLRARLRRHPALHRGGARPRGPDPAREHDAGARPRLPRDGRAGGDHPRLADGAPLERPAAPRPRRGRRTSACARTGRSTTRTSRRSCVCAGSSWSRSPAPRTSRAT